MCFPVGFTVVLFFIFIMTVKLNGGEFFMLCLLCLYCYLTGGYTVSMKEENYE